MTAAVSGVVPDDTFTVSQAVNALGFGKFQILLSFVTGTYARLLKLRQNNILISRFFSSRSLLDGRLHGDHDPEHLVPGPGLRLGDQPVQPGSPHHGRLHRYDVQLHILGVFLGQVRTETGPVAIRYVRAKNAFFGPF